MVSHSICNEDPFWKKYIRKTSEINQLFLSFFFSFFLQFHKRNIKTRICKIRKVEEHFCRENCIALIRVEIVKIQEILFFFNNQDCINLKLR